MFIDIFHHMTLYYDIMMVVISCSNLERSDLLLLILSKDFNAPDKGSLFRKGHI